MFYPFDSAATADEEDPSDLQPFQARRIHDNEGSVRSGI
jgi:hypothetical protein